MNVILVHGMGRTPLSMAWLGFCLRRAGHDVDVFSYSARREDFFPCAKRLGHFVEAIAAGKSYAVVGHSLGTMLLREALARIRHKPAAAILLAPPTRACEMAKRLSRWRVYRFLTGECGQLLACEAFMRSLPASPANSTIIAGTRGPRHWLLPHKSAPNDGILAVEETRLAGVRHFCVKASHTFIMNHALVFRRILLALRAAR